MNIVNPPAAADGGYWYAVQATKDAEGGWTVPVMVGVGWCAWYADIGGVKYAAMRCPAPVTDMSTASVTVTAILSAAGYSSNPYGRIGGK